MSERRAELVKQAQADMLKAALKKQGIELDQVRVGYQLHEEGRERRQAILKDYEKKLQPLQAEMAEIDRELDDPKLADEGQRNDLMEQRRTLLNAWKLNVEWCNAESLEALSGPSQTAKTEQLPAVQRESPEILGHLQLGGNEKCVLQALLDNGAFNPLRGVHSTELAEKALGLSEPDGRFGKACSSLKDKALIDNNGRGQGASGYYLTPEGKRVAGQLPK